MSRTRDHRRRADHYSDRRHWTAERDRKRGPLQAPPDGPQRPQAPDPEPEPDQDAAAG